MILKKLHYINSPPSGGDVVDVGGLVCLKEEKG